MHIICYTGSGGLSENDHMNEMTLPSIHVIQNSSSGCQRSSTLPHGDGGTPQYCIFASEMGRNMLFVEPCDTMQ